jgi:hypothetical protein
LITDPTEIANKWYKLHKSKKNLTPRFYDDPLIENRIGVAGELAFGHKYEIMDYWNGLEEKPYGDEGDDFDVPHLGTIDVKTARKPFHLLSKKGKTNSDYYVLAKYINDNEIHFIGWAHGYSLLEVEPRDVGGYGLISHYIHNSKLLPMGELECLILDALASIALDRVLDKADPIFKLLTKDQQLSLFGI